MAEEPELTGSDSDPETTAQGGNTGGTGEEASLGASGSSGAEWSGVERGGGLNSQAGTLKHMNNVATINILRDRF